MKNPKLIGSYISHLGIALLILGAVISGGYSTTKQVRLKTNETKAALGYNFTFTGYNQIETEFNDREKYKYHVKIEKDGKTNVASPVVYWSDFNEKQSPFLEPGVYTKMEKDIYLSPKAIEQETEMPRIALKKDEVAQNPIDSSFNVSVISFSMDKNSAFMGDKVVLNTIVKYEYLDGTSATDSLQSLLDANSWEAQPVWKKVPGTNTEISMTKLIRDMENIQNTRAALNFKIADKPLPEPVDVFTFDVTIKPFINLVWIGTLAMVAGFFVALSKYSKSNSKNIAEE
jgi:cytochrome c-type biogenesis protein CcmF